MMYIFVYSFMAYYAYFSVFEFGNYLYNNVLLECSIQCVLPACVFSVCVCVCVYVCV